jgi:hypothetical protein
MLLIPEKTIFVHIPKTGGSSVEEFIMDYYGYERNECLLVHGFGTDLNVKESYFTPYPMMHYKLDKIVRIAERNKVKVDDTWTIFSIVRNPYYKFLSELFFVQFSSLRYHHHMVPKVNKEGLINSCVDEYFKHPTAFSTYHSNHSLPQYKFFENVDVNYKIFKFEEGLENIITQLGFEIKKKLPHLLNVSEYDNVPKPNYKEMLTSYLIDTVNTKYQKDFELFGYEMLDPNNIS